jgi:hypothetical protein
LYQQGLPVLQQQLSVASWLRGQSALAKKKGGSIVRGGDDEEEDDRHSKTARLVSRADVLADFVKATSSVLGRVGGLAAGA